MRQFVLLFFLICGVNAFGQQQTFEGTVLDSIGNPVKDATICILYPTSYPKKCVSSNRWGNYRIDLTEGDLISTEIKYDSIPNLIRYYEYKEDPFDGFSYLTEMEKVEEELAWKTKYDSLGISDNLPIKKREDNFHIYGLSRIEIEGDSARLMNDEHYVKGRLGFDLNVSYSISEHLKTPKLQNIYTQGRPNNGAYEHFGSPEAFSWGPLATSISGLNQYDPNRFFQKGNGLKVGLNAAYERNNNYWNFNFNHRTDEGLFEPIKTTKNTFAVNYNFPAWGGTWKTKAAVSFEKTNMPLVGNNYMNVLYSAWSTPFHFDTSPTIINDEQNSASNRYNNAAFLLEYNRDLKKENIYSLGTGYSIKLKEWDIGGDINYNYTQHSLDYGQIPTMAEVNNPLFFKRQMNNHLANLILNAKYRNNMTNLFSIDFNWLHQLDISQLEKDEYSNYNSIYNFPLAGISNRLYDESKQRYNSILSTEINYRQDLNNLELRNTLSPSIYYTNTNDQAFAYQLRNSLILDSEYLLGDFKFVFGLNYEISHTEPELISQNLNFNALNQSLNDFMNYTEPYELILNNQLKKLQQKRLTEVVLGVGVDGVFNLDFSYFYHNVDNAFAPVFRDGNFIWDNVANYHQQGFDINLTKGYFLNSNVFNWDFNLNFHSYKNKTDHIISGEDRVPYFGFSEVSKNFIEGQPVGVIVGNDYLRNASGQMIIGDDGFPLIDDNLKIIADPNPDFTMKWYNRVRVHNFSLGFNFEWQKGGQIWNGTQNTLDFYGRSQNSADLRNTTGFIFDGVNMNGEQNTIPVDFSNPAYDLSENRWVRYGVTGVASDAIEDASYIRLQNISLNYETKLRKYHYSTITQFSIGVFANNLWVSSKYSGVHPGNGLLGNASGVGLDYFNFPLTRVYGISMNLKF